MRALDQVKALLDALPMDEQEELLAHLAGALAPAQTEGPERPRTGPWYVDERVRCGKPTCRCAKGELHGPYRYEYRREDGRLRKRYVGKAQAARREGAGRPRAK